MNLVSLTPVNKQVRLLVVRDVAKLAEDTPEMTRPRRRPVKK